MKKLILSFVFLCVHFVASAQVGIGTTSPDPSSILDLSSSAKGFIAPRISLNSVSNSSIDGVNTNANGLMIYNTNASVTGGNGVGYYYWNGSTWTAMKAAASSGNNWALTGNSGTNSSTNFLGTTDGQPLNFRVNNVGIGPTLWNASRRPSCFSRAYKPALIH